MPIKLVYFNGRGLAEITRYMLSIAGVDFEDYRFPITADFKRPEFDAAKSQYPENMGRIPILEVDGKKIGQSSTIARYVAKKYGFAGSDEIEEALTDMYFEHVKDIKDAYQKVRGITNEAEKTAAMDKWFASDLPEWLGKLEASIVGSGGFAVGTKLSLADITIYYFLTSFFDNKEGTKKAYEALPKLSAIVAATAAHEGIKAWEAKRPVTPF